MKPNISALLAGFCLSVLSASAATITSVTWNDPVNGNVTSTDNTGIEIQYASTLVSFNVGTTTYSTFSTATSTTASGGTGITPYWGINATNLTAADDQLSVTDNRIDTGMVNIGNDSEFFFAAPTSLDQIFFVFDAGGGDGNRTVEFIDGALGNVVGNSITVDFSTTTIAQMDFERVNGAGTAVTNNTGFRGVALSFSDFGITNAATLSSIAGVRIDGGDSLDPTMLGFAAVPEPGSVALIALTSGLFVLRRRR
ncbi:PEP-CTERM sorting domain-containing protein [Haloferula sp. A504]|uniref:PEP-CTERM sorting domain-containing protein n=1 Tax=Haloferula sp. A504 TaxID=3373601 RepID=UPI0031BDD539|nr:PEP-CTERM sorting domain-containing protein [Verrucomicrobiaceae bacterium E54]